MYIKLLGFTLIFLGIILAGIVATDVQIYYKVEGFAKAVEDNKDLSDTVVEVPPYNSSEGWVGFNFTLPNQGKTHHEAYGVMLPSDQDPKPNVTMAAVNGSGLDLLAFDHFSTETWDVTKVYTRAFLDSTHKYSSFQFLDLDNCSEYVLLFRGLKNESASRPILISVKESWLDHASLLPPAVGNAGAVTSVLLGPALVVYDFRLDRIKRKRTKPKLRKKAL